MGRRRNTRRKRKASKKKSRSRQTRSWSLITKGALALVLLAMAGLSWLMIGYPRQRGPNLGVQAEITLAQDATIEAVASRLGELEVLRHPKLFAIYMRWIGGDEHLRVGTFEVTDGMTHAALARRLALGFGSAPVRVVVPEGFTRFDLAKRLARHGVCDAQAFLEATTDEALLAHEGIESTTFEGYLFPDTYELATDMRPMIVVKRLVRTWRLRVLPLIEENAAGFAKLRRDLGFGIREAMILASVVEKEAAVRPE